MNRGDRAIRFIQNLKHVKSIWAGQKLLLEQWQRDFVGKLFGTLNPEGLRQYRNAFVFIPRKNSKSTLAAAIAIYCLVSDGEQGAEIYSAANDREQASVVFDIAASMVRADKYLSSLCRILDSQKKIIYKKTNSIYKALSAESGTKHGLNPSVVIYDELHEAKNSELFDALKSGMGARQQPLFITLTTAGYDRLSLCYQMYSYACRVRDGVIKDDTFLPIIYEAPKGSDWQSEDTWRAANPNYGVSVLPSFVAQAAELAKEMPSRLYAFQRLQLNIWTEASVRWLPQAQWDAGAVAPLTLDDLQGKECWAALDLSATTDITALVLIFPHDGGWLVRPYFWLPAETAKRREREAGIPYRAWADAGHIELTEGNAVDYDRVRQRIGELATQYNIRQIGIDRWNATQITNQLTGDGFDVVPVGQGFASMSAPSKELEKLVWQGKLWHWGNPVLAWMASNAVADIDAAGNVKPSKAKSSEKIDGISALVTALALGIVRDANAGALLTGSFLV